MKTAKPPQADAPGPSSRRAQPLRQTRTNPPRTNSGSSRTTNGREGLGGGRSHDQPIDIFPAITHFTDAITSLPKDLVRHFTLLKEVDAKIFSPEEALFQYVDAALKSQPPESRNVRDSSSAAPTSTPMSAQNSSNSHALSSHPAPGSINESHASTLADPSSVPRRRLFHCTAYKIQDLLVSLEEKNHVISTANEALSKQLARINDVWPHLENEFSDEAKWGSTTHWAYPENRIHRAQTERSRRDGAAYITAAAQQLQVEEAAARSDARKQALIAKKGLKNQHQDSDADDHENKQKSESSRKTQGNGKTRKAAEPATPVGLGITAATNANGNPPSKRRRVDNTSKVVNGGQPAERAMSSVYGNNAPKPKNASPRATPAPETTKKRKALPTANGASKKSKTATTSAAAVAVSPLIQSPTPQPNPGEKSLIRGSPAPPVAAPRPVSSRARQNSIQSNIENSRQRPVSSASNRPNNVITGPSEVAIPNGPRAFVEPKAIPAAIVKAEPSKEEMNNHLWNAANGLNKKDSHPKSDCPEPKAEPAQNQQQTTGTVVTTKSGRASKPSTPALGTLPDPPPRSRSSRNTTTAAKRSHKKGASQHAIPTRIVDEDTNSSGQGDDEGDVDADEPLYCYCNGVSYGEMVACDAEDCEREWFHLDCVGLKAAPPSNMKWYCDNCKDHIKTGRKVNGR
ncbi:hypothetical protein GGS21DRAFT_522311 [Xylaria nigripes]|nr:hypothetical protein GGS21DRAFT_522311 [Xylaria nigripes]